MTPQKKVTSATGLLPAGAKGKKETTCKVCEPHPTFQQTFFDSQWCGVLPPDAVCAFLTPFPLLLKGAALHVLVWNRMVISSKLVIKHSCSISLALLWNLSI